MDAALHEAAGEWVRAGLAARGLRPAAPPQTLHQRPWSLVQRWPAGAEAFIFKAVHPALCYEAALTAALGRWSAGDLPAVLAADAQRGWLLLEDGRQTLRAAFQAGLGRDAWAPLLGRYARLQISAAAHTAELLAAGVPDRRPAALLAVVDELLASEQTLVAADAWQRLRAGRAQLGEMLAELAEGDLPPTVEHGDLHDANVFFGDGSARIFDWGDAAISHPFFSLRTAFVSVENHFGLAENDPVLDALAREYLGAWTVVAGPAATARAYTLARRLWALNTLAKVRFLRRELGPAAIKPAVLPSLLREFLAANPELGRVS